MAAAEQKLRAAGTALWLVALNPEAFKVVERSPLGRALGHGRMFVNLAQALEAFQATRGTAARSEDRT